MTELHERILVVDDEVNVRALYSRVLQKEGYTVECAASGGEAIEKLATSSFDLVVTDLKMNGVDGLEVVKRGKAVNRKVPFILISGYGTAQMAITAAKEGADIFLMKPIDIADLKAAVKGALANKLA
jgi:DNA-binding NtrC family response regulator